MLKELTLRADLVGQMMQEGVSLAYDLNEQDRSGSLGEWLKTMGGQGGDPLQAIKSLRQDCEEALEDRNVLDDDHKRLRFEVAYSALSAVEQMFHP